MSPEIKINDELKLRFLNPEDASVIHQMLEESPDIRRYVALFTDCETEEEVREEITDQMEHGALRYGIIKNDDLIGYIGIWQDTDIKDVVQYNISYFLADEHRGGGIVTMALQQLLNEAEKNLKIDRFSAWSEEGNEAGVRVLLNLGFVTTNTPHQNNHGTVSWKYVKEFKHG